MHSGGGVGSTQGGGGQAGSAWGGDDWNIRLMRVEVCRLWQLLQGLSCSMSWSLKVSPTRHDLQGPAHVASKPLGSSHS